MPGKSTVFKDVLKYIPRKKFTEWVERHGGDKWCKHILYWDVFMTLLHGQLSDETSMRQVSLGATCQAMYLQQLEARAVALSTLSDTCKVRNPEVLLEVFKHVLGELKRVQQLDKPLKSWLYLVDSTPIMLKGYGYEWVKNNYRIQGLKVHTVYDAHLKSPVHFTITAPTVNDITEGKKIPLQRRHTYVFDKAYYDYAWWNELHQTKCRFITRLKKDAPYRLLERRAVAGHLKHDWVIELTSKAGKRYKGVLRHIRVKLEQHKTIVIITHDLTSSAAYLASLYKKRWDIELFFKCLKQNLTIKRFWGKNENAVLLQIITAMIAYVLLRLVQLKTQTTYSLQQIRLVIRLKLYEANTVYRILKIPDKPRSREIRSVI